MARGKNIIFVVTGILVIFVIATVLSLAASSYPDGLEKVAENFGFMDKAHTVLPEGFFLAPDYTFKGTGNKYLQTSLAGFLGVLVIFFLFSVIFLLYRFKTNKNTVKKNEKIQSKGKR
ncbi:MAG: PDGLE domain-containing protein [Actinomycetota bacterium]